MMIVISSFVLSAESNCKIGAELSATKMTEILPIMNTDFGTVRTAAQRLEKTDGH